MGANDGLRGLPLREMRHTLARMIGASRYVGAKVLLVGMRILPNYGADYADGFEQVYRDLAAHFDVALLPFLLAHIAADRDRMNVGWRKRVPVSVVTEGCSSHKKKTN